MPTPGRMSAGPPLGQRKLTAVCGGRGSVRPGGAGPTAGQGDSAVTPSPSLRNALGLWQHHHLFSSPARPPPPRFTSSIPVMEYA